MRQNIEMILKLVEDSLHGGPCGLCGRSGMVSDYEREDYKISICESCPSIVVEEEVVVEEEIHKKTEKEK